MSSIWYQSEPLSDYQCMFAICFLVSAFVCSTRSKNKTACRVSATRVGVSNWNCTPLGWRDRRDALVHFASARASFADHCCATSHRTELVISLPAWAEIGNLWSLFGTHFRPAPACIFSALPRNANTAPPSVNFCLCACYANVREFARRRCTRSVAERDTNACDNVWICICNICICICICVYAYMYIYIWICICPVSSEYPCVKYVDVAGLSHTMSVVCRTMRLKWCENYIDTDIHDVLRCPKHVFCQINEKSARKTYVVDIHINVKYWYCEIY